MFIICKKYAYYVTLWHMIIKKQTLKVKRMHHLTGKLEVVELNNRFMKINHFNAVSSCKFYVNPLHFIVSLLNSNYSWNLWTIVKGKAVYLKNLLNYRVHQLIHYKFVRKSFLAPYRRFKMKLTDTLNCTKYSLNTVGTHLHTFCDRPDVSNLWSLVAVFLEDILELFGSCI